MLGAEAQRPDPATHPHAATPDNPNPTPAPFTFSSISAGWYHTCGILDGQGEQTAGRMACWGAENILDESNKVQPTQYKYDPKADFGQAALPAELADVAFSSVSAGRYHTCALRADTGLVACWGRPELAEIPERLRNTRFTSVSISSFINCGITADSRVKCWGPTELDRPDDGDPDTPLYPESPFNLNQFPVPAAYADQKFSAVDAGRWHVCATNPAGRVVCWGADAYPGPAGHTDLS